MRKIILFIATCFLFSTYVSAQNIYSWNEKKITINSPIILQNQNYSSSFVLSGNNIKIEVSTLEGMEGISGLAGSLDSYASSFDYVAEGNARDISNLKNMNAATLSATISSKNVLFCMFATKDYKQHFVCEITYSGNQKFVAESIINSLAFDNDDVVNNDTNNDVVIPDNDTDNTESTELAVGKMAPNFTLTDTNGNQLSLSSLKGKVVLLDFWGTWCGPCIQGIPHLKELYEKYKDNGFEILSIASDTNTEKWANMVRKKSMTWKNVIDSKDQVAPLYKIKAYPTLMLIDEKGILISVGISDSEVDEY